MGISIHGMAFSTCTQRVAMTLEELGVPYEIKAVNLMAGEHKQPEYLKIQPFGQIPVLEDSDLGTTIFESRSIIRYLANKHADKGLAGTDATSKALVDNWLEAESQNFNPPASGIVGERVFKPMRGGQTDEENVKKLLAKLDPTLDVFEQRLATNKYLAGDDFSLADIAAMPYLNMLIQAAGESDRIKSRPNVQAWADRIFGRPTWQKVLSLSKK